MQIRRALGFFRRRFPFLVLALAPFVHAPSAHANCLQLGRIAQGGVSTESAPLINRCLNRVGYVYCIKNGSNGPFYCADGKFGAGFVPAGGSDRVSVFGATGPAIVLWYECEAKKPDDYPIPVNPRFDMIEVNADCPRSDDGSNPFSHGNAKGGSDNPFTPDKTKDSSDNPFKPGSGKTAQSQTNGKGASNAKAGTSSLEAKSNGTNASNGPSPKASIPPSSQYSGSFFMRRGHNSPGYPDRPETTTTCEGTFSIAIDNVSGAVSGTAEVSNPTSTNTPVVSPGECITKPQMYMWRSTVLSGSVSTVPSGQGGFTQTINGSLHGTDSFADLACSWSGSFSYTPPSPPTGNGAVSCINEEPEHYQPITGSWSTN